jgi:hypothetical protein
MHLTGTKIPPGTARKKKIPHGPGKKAPQPVLYFFFYQQAEDRTTIKIKLCDILDP